MASHLLAGRDLAGIVTTMDVLLTQAAPAQQIRRQHGHYLMVIKKNQPTLYWAAGVVFREPPFAPAKASDSRWVHRPFTDWDKMALRDEAGTPEARLYGELRRLIQVRKGHPLFAGGDMAVVDAGNPHVFAFVRQGPAGRVLVLANFSEREQKVAANTVRAHGLGYMFHDLAGDTRLALGDELVLEPYRFLWLVAV